MGATLGASTFSLVAVTAANILIARSLGVSGQGTVAAGTLVPMIVAYAGELGIPVATGYLINAQSTIRLRTIAAARFIAFTLGSALVAVSVALSMVLDLPEASRSLSIFYSGFAFLNLFQRVHLAVLQADLRLRTFNRVRMAGAATYLGVLVLYALTGTATPFLVVLALVVANVVWCVLSAVPTFSRPYCSPDGDRIKALFSYGARSHLGNVSAVDALKLDQLVLALFLDTRALGLYVAAMTVMMANRIIGVSVGMVCFPIAARGPQESSGPRRQLRLLMLGTLIASGAVALPEILLGGRLLGLLFGDDFARGGSALGILAVASIFSNLRQVLGDWLRGSGRPGLVAVSELAGVVILACLPIVLWDGSIDRVAWVVAASSLGALLCLAVADAVIRTGHMGPRGRSVPPLPVSVDGALDHQLGV